MKQAFIKITVKAWRIAFWLQQRLHRSTGKGMSAKRSRLYEKIWTDAALELGANLTSLGNGFFSISQGKNKTLVLNSITGLDSPITLKLAGNKPLSHKWLTDANVPVPAHQKFSASNQLQSAEHFLQQAPGAIVIKPAAGTAGGDGVTTGIRTVSQLHRAIALASLDKNQLIAEHMVPGNCYRFLYLDGELLDAVVRHPPSVVGDGKKTIDELISETNERRCDSEHIIALGEVSRDLDLQWTIKAQGLKSRSVLAKGEKVAIKTVANDGATDDSESVTHLVSEALCKDGARAAAALGVRLAGVDIMTSDLSVSLADSGGVVIEVNTTPGLHLHYLTRLPGLPPAVPILRLLLSESET